MNKTDPISHLSRQSEKYSALNDPRKWWKTVNPPLVNQKKWQKQIDGITGLTLRGQSKILLRWAWEANYVMYDRRRYWYGFTTVMVNGVPTDFSVPRWVVMERVEPEQIRESWEASRYTVEPSSVVNEVDPVTGIVKKVVYAGDKLDKGPCPGEWFRDLWTIADHDELCCKKAEAMNRACWGYYRHPDRRDVKRVEKIHGMKMKDDSFNQSPFETLSPETLAETAKSVFAEQQAEKVRRDRDLASRIQDVMRTHEYSLAYEGPRYHFGENVGPYRKTESGILIPT